MKIAMPIWEGGISPVLDSARRLLVVEVEEGVEVDRSEVPFDEGALPARARHVLALGVDVLICGGVSRALARLFAGERIEVIPWTSGNPDQVLTAYLAGGLSRSQFAMPGCGGVGRRRRRGSGRGRRCPGSERL